VACHFFQTEEMLHYCLAFACVYGRDANLPAYAAASTFEQLNEYKTVRRTVNRFAWRFRGTMKELQSALFRVMPDIDAPHPIPVESSDLDDDALLADLQVGAGRTSEYWQRKDSGFVFKVVESMYKQAVAKGGGEQDDPEYRAAMMDYDMALNVCRDAHAKELNHAA